MAPSNLASLHSRSSRRTSSRIKTFFRPSLSLFLILIFSILSQSHSLFADAAPLGSLISHGTPVTSSVTASGPQAASLQRRDTETQPADAATNNREESQHRAPHSPYIGPQNPSPPELTHNSDGETPKVENVKVAPSTAAQPEQTQAQGPQQQPPPSSQ